MRFPLYLGLILLFSAPGASALAIELRFLDSVHWPATLRYNENTVSGLSALSRRADGTFLALSDDREVPRAYVLEIKIQPQPPKLHVAVREEILLRDKSGAAFPIGTVDAESLVVLPDGGLIVGMEGDMERSPRVAPSVNYFSPDGRQRGELPLPLKFLPEARGEQTCGVRNNEGFEGLTLAPDRENLLAFAEGALVQDGDSSTLSSGASLRVLHWRKLGGEFTSFAEYLYPLSPLPRVLDGEMDGVIGVSDALALDGDSWLVLERALVYNASSGRFHARLFAADRIGADDVSALESLRSDASLVRPLGKKLVLDFDYVTPLLPEGHRNLDNLEAMAWGPKLPNGHDTLIFVSDSNFLSLQETQFLLFEVLP